MPFHGRLDWGGAAHAVCLIDGTGQVVARMEVRHDVVGLANLLARLKRIARPAELPIAIEHTVATLPDGQIVMSFPRTGRICAAQILVEFGNVRERFPIENQLAAEAGVCPVTHASGKSRGVTFRWACNKNLRATVTCFADNSRHA